jgi:hypothetical protein
MWIGSDALFQLDDQPRLADAGLSGDQHHAALAGFRLAPAALQQVELLVAADHRCQRTAVERLGAAGERGLAAHAPDALGCIEAFQFDGAKVLHVKQAAQQRARRFAHHERVGLR